MSPTTPHADLAATERWRTILTEGHGSLVKARRVFRHLPSAPRCKVCSNPFAGVGGRVMGAAGFRPSRKNPALCSRCCDSLPPGGAEVDVAVLFADVRGSTSLGEQSAPHEFAELLNRFYAAATGALLRYDAIVDKLIGDEVMAFFVRGIAGDDYRGQAVRAGVDLLRAGGYGTEDGPWIRIGAAVNAISRLERQVNLPVTVNTGFQGNAQVFQAALQGRGYQQPSQARGEFPLPLGHLSITRGACPSELDKGQQQRQTGRAVSQCRHA